MSASRAFATDLVVRGSAYRSLVRDRPGDDKRQPSLTPRGRWLERRVAKARESVPALRRLKVSRRARPWGQDLTGTTDSVDP